MPSQRLDIETARGVMPVHVTRPDGGGPAPLVIMYMDSLGIRNVLHEHARRLTHAGYATVWPARR